MGFKTVSAALVCVAVLASGCSETEEALFPDTDAPSVEAADANAAPSAQAAAMPAAMPQVTTSSLSATPAMSSGGASGTFVGAKVSALRADLRQLQNTLGAQNQTLQDIRGQTVADSQQYHGTLAAISARLQVGTTPGNPVLTQQWNAAQAELDRISEDVLRMNRLANDVTTSSGLVAYLLESVRAARQLSGAVDEDHRQLAILEDDTNRTAVSIERLLGELSVDVSRQQQYIAVERQNLNTMAVAVKNGQLYGASMAAQQGFSGATGARADVMTDAPLVTIRFDKPHVNYEGALYAAVKGAVDRRPDASFDVIGVSPTGGSPGQDALSASSVRRNADQVARSLANFGLPAGRVRVSTSTSASARAGEVQVFVR